MDLRLLSSQLQRRPRLKKVLPAAAALLLTCAVYIPSLGNGFVWDAHFVVVENGFIKSWKNLPHVFSRDYLTKAQDMSLAGVKAIGSGESSYRPVVTLSYFLDYALWKLNPLGYHAHNLLLHLLNTLLVYLLVLHLARDRFAAFWSALLFGWHPVHAEAVCGIGNREDLQACLFFLLSFLCYVRMGGEQPRRQGTLYGISLTAFFLALFSKEMAVTLPLVLVLYDLLYREPGQQPRLFIGRPALYAGYGAVLAFYAFVRFHLFVIPGGLGGGVVPHVLTMVRVVATYVRWLVFPTGLHHIIPEDRSLTALSLVDGKVLLSIAVLGGLLLEAVAFRRSRRDVSFGLGWFFLTILPVLNIVPLQNYMGLRFVYIPSFGFCLLAGALWAEWSRKAATRRNPARRMLPQVTVIVLLIFFAALTLQRTRVWKNDLSFGLDLARHYPRSPRILCILGTYLQAAGKTDRAMQAYEKTIALDPRYGKAYLCRGIIYQQQKRTEAARKDFERALELNPRLWYTHSYLGNIYARRKMYPRAIEHYRELLKRAPGQTAAINNLGMIYLNMRDPDQARAMWQKTLRIDPDNSFALQRLRELSEMERSVR